MYKRIVAGKVRKVFDDLNAGDTSSLVDGLTKDCHHRTDGTHALGGERHDKASVAAWYDRLMEVLPGIHFTVDDVRVSGWPWHTNVVVGWRDEAKVGPHHYRNAGTNRMVIRFGKVSELLIDCDETALAEACSAAGSIGREAGVQPPINS